MKSKIFVQLSIKICQYYQWLRSVACLLSIMSSNVKVVHPLENFLICDRCAQSWKKRPQILLQVYFVNAAIITQIMIIWWRSAIHNCSFSTNGNQYWTSIFDRLHLSSISVLVKFTILQKNAHGYPDLEFVKKFTRPNFPVKEFYTLKTRKSRLFSPTINSKNTSLSVIWPSFG